MFGEDLPNRNVCTVINKQVSFPCPDYRKPRLKPKGCRRNPADIKLLRHSKRSFARIHSRTDKEGLITVIHIYLFLLRRPYHFSCHRVSDLNDICCLSVLVQKTEAAILKHQRHSVLHNDRTAHISFCSHIVLTRRAVSCIRRVQRRVLIFRHSSRSVIYENTFPFGKRRRCDRRDTYRSSFLLPVLPVPIPDILPVPHDDPRAVLRMEYGSPNCFSRTFLRSKHTVSFHIINLKIAPRITVIQSIHITVSQQKKPIIQAYRSIRQSIKKLPDRCPQSKIFCFINCRVCARTRY